MAVVFRARDERLSRPVALKILSPELASDSEFRRRFIGESRAAAAVDDPHIIPVYEAGEADGVLFIAMRFVQGGDLRMVLDREGALPPDGPRGSSPRSPRHSMPRTPPGWCTGTSSRGTSWWTAGRGRPDHVYLSDFGVSKGAVPTGTLTGTGIFIGTPDYGAPEQIQGLPVDGRADQYSLACVTYNLLTGTLPFERTNAMAVMLAHVSSPASVAVVAAAGSAGSRRSRCWPRRWPSSRRSGTNRAGTSPTRCGKHSACLPTTPSVPPPRWRTRQPRLSRPRTLIQCAR